MLEEVGQKGSASCQTPASLFIHTVFIQCQFLPGPVPTFEGQYPTFRMHPVSDGTHWRILNGDEFDSVENLAFPYMTSVIPSQEVT